MLSKIFRKRISHALKKGGEIFQGLKVAQHRAKVLRGENGKTSVLRSEVKWSEKRCWKYRRGRKKFDSLLSLMNLLLRYLWKEEFEYYSDKSVKAFRIEMEQLFEKTYGWNFSVNLVGEFVSEDEFKAKHKWEFIHIKNYERDSAYLNGKIAPLDKNRTLVKFSVRPNSIYIIIPCILICISAAIFGQFTRNEMKITEALTFMSVFGIVVPLLSMIGARSVKKKLKKTFITTFNLQPIQEPTNH